MTRSGSVPVVAVSGPLGAGKTSVVNALLRAPGARIGVVVNDFGAVNLDAGLIVGQVDEVSSIAGGCICCLPDSGGLDDALERLTDPRLALDVVLVEASGAADPAVLSRMIRFSGAPRARWGGVIEVVDAEWFSRTRPDDRYGDARYRAASVIVANRVDRTPDIGRVLVDLAAAGPRAVVLPATNGAIDPAVVFDAAERAAPDELDFAAVMGSAPPHRHADAITVRQDGPASAASIVGLLESPPPGVARVKGILDVRTGRSVRPYVLHLVAGVPHVEPLTTSTRLRALVAIGFDFDGPSVEGALREALADSADDGAGLRRFRRLLRLSR